MKNIKLLGDYGLKQPLFPLFSSIVASLFNMEVYDIQCRYNKYFIRKAITKRSKISTFVYNKVYCSVTLCTF